MKRTTPLPICHGPYGDPAATNQKDYWRVVLQLLERTKVDLVLLVLMSLLLLPMDIPPPDWLLSTKAVSVLVAFVQPCHRGEVVNPCWCEAEVPSLDMAACLGCSGLRAQPVDGAVGM